MEDRRLEHFGDVRAVHRRARIQRIGRRESHLIIDHHVQRATGVITRCLRKLHRLHDDTLASECCVAMNQNRHDTSALGITTPLLARAHGTFGDRTDDLEVRGVEGQRHVHVAAGRAQIRRKAFVVFDVAGAREVDGIVFAFKFREQHGGRLAEHIDQYVQASAMRHCDDKLFHALLPATLNDIIQQRNQCIAAFEREAFLPDILGMQVAFETFCGRELPQNVFALIGSETMLHAACLKLILQPQALLGIRNVSEFGADRAAINMGQLRNDVAQLGVIGD